MRIVVVVVFPVGGFRGAISGFSVIVFREPTMLFPGAKDPILWFVEFLLLLRCWVKNDPQISVW